VLSANTQTYFAEDHEPENHGFQVHSGKTRKRSTLYQGTCGHTSRNAISDTPVTPTHICKPPAPFPRKKQHNRNGNLLAAPVCGLPPRLPFVNFL
jgi:hypothetical protein